ncbi:hypothetical protein TNCV_883571 [Trichonephila clavipes]|nr:hypothetical protein TNCV_883571 [Trichonephila clavipes]
MTEQDETKCFHKQNCEDLEQADCKAAHRAAEAPEQSQARRQVKAEYLASRRADETPEQSHDRRRQHAEYLASKRAAETPEQSQARRHTWRLKEIQKPWKQRNLADALLLKKHNSDV